MTLRRASMRARMRSSSERCWLRIPTGRRAALRAGETVSSLGAMRAATATLRAAARRERSVARLVRTVAGRGLGGSCSPRSRGTGWGRVTTSPRARAFDDLIALRDGTPENVDAANRQRAVERHAAGRRSARRLALTNARLLRRGRRRRRHCGFPRGRRERTGVGRSVAALKLRDRVVAEGVGSSRSANGGTHENTGEALIGIAAKPSAIGNPVASSLRRGRQRGD